MKFEPQSIPLLALPFVPFAERKRLPRLTAIYFVLNAEGTVLYIGQSINLATRWAAHHRTAKLLANQATRIAWLVMDDEALLDAVETACIAYFQPLCNGVESGTGGRPKTDAAKFVHFALRLPKNAMDVVRARSARSGAPLNTELVRAILRDLHMPATPEPADDQADPRPSPQRSSRATRASV